MDESISAEGKRQGAPKPPLSVGRIAGEILAGIATGFAAGLLAGFGFVKMSGLHRGDDRGWAVMAALYFLVFPAAYSLTCGGGVYLVGTRGKQTGSFSWTLGCGLAGGLVIWGMSPIILALDQSLWLANVASPVPVIPLLMALLIIPPILATLGFNATRRYRKQPSS